MRKLLSVLLTGALVLGTLTGCGSSSDADATKNSTKTENTSKKENASTGESSDNKVIKVAASSTPHGEILEQAKKILKDKGYDLQVTIFDDYVQPNQVVESGEFDANYFQHKPYHRQQIDKYHP